MDEELLFSGGGLGPGGGHSSSHTLKALGLENLIPDKFILDRKLNLV